MARHEAEPGRKEVFQWPTLAHCATLDNRAQTYVAVSTVHHIYRLFEESGTVDPVHNTILMGYFVYVTRSRCEWYGRIHGNFEHSHSSTMV